MKTTVGLVLYSLLLTSCKLTNTMPDRQLVKRKTIKNEASQDQSSRENRANDNPDVAEVSAGDAASVEELFQEFTEGSALPGTFTLSKPVNWQVFQRKNATEGDLSFEISEAITSARFLRARLLKNGQAINDNW